MKFHFFLFGSILVSNLYIRTQTKSYNTPKLYKNEHLYFQILIQSQDNIDIYGEFDDYNEYRETFDRLQKNQSEKSILKIVSERTFKSDSCFAKVA